MGKQLEQHLKNLSERALESRPLIFNLKKSADQRSLERLLKSKKIIQVVDDYEEQQRELYGINNPTKVYSATFDEQFQGYYTAIQKRWPAYQDGNWAYFPWLGALVHILDDKDFQRVRTARNRNLINEQEQQKYYETVIGICGLSVGNSVALAIALQGGARHIRLADFDRLALSNLNRIRAGVDSLGLQKVEITARQIYQLNPYATVEIFPEGLQLKNVKKFFDGPPKLDIVIDEMDNLAMKYVIRQEAQKRKLPVIMGADNGDNAVIDIDRFDQNPKTKYFHGRMGKISYEQLVNLEKFGIGKLITKLVGPENVTQRMKESLLAMGKTLVSWPQLGGAALLNGSALAYCARKIAIGQPLESNRALISLDELLIPGYHSKSNTAKRKKEIEQFKRIFGLS